MDDRSANVPRRCALQELVAIPLLIVAGVGWAHRFVTDDGYIYFRVVDQVTSGNGPVFNVGERVEVFTSPLWVAVLSVGDLATPIRLEWLAVVLGLALGAVGLGFAMAGAADARAPRRGRCVPRALRRVHLRRTPAGMALPGERLDGPRVRVGRPAPARALDWVRTGRRLSVWREAVLGLGWLVRPELVLLSALFVVLVLAIQWRSDGWLLRMRFLGAALVPVVYQIFRMGYHGA